MGSIRYENNNTEMIDPYGVSEHLITHVHREWICDELSRHTFCVLENGLLVIKSKVLILKRDLLHTRSGFLTFLSGNDSVMM